MFAVRHSGARTTNEHVRRQEALGDEGNVAWLERSGISEGVLLIGGSRLTDVRLRVAQSRLRSDISPSHWSAAAILTGGEVITVPLEAIGDPASFAARNGVTRLPLKAFDDPVTHPNIAVLLFSSTFSPVVDALADVQTGRAVLDVPALSAAWLSALWGVADLDEPLREGQGIPSAALVELAHAIAGIELTPGLESTASCPEAIWQAARWWTDYYRASAEIALRAGPGPAEGHAQPSVPAGAYVIRSRLVEPEDLASMEVVDR